MCNPRRVRVTATRELNEAWQREVTRTIEMRERVRGEARVRQQLDTALGTPTLRALESALVEDASWVEVDEGYRYDLEGGYVIYLLEERALEIVAVLEDDIVTTEQETRLLQGRVTAEISAEGEGRYYDDGWGGRTLEVGEKDAQAAAQRQLEEQSRAKLEQAGIEAESEVAAEIEAAARHKATERLQQQAGDRQTALAQQARQHLETVGLRGRQVFHQVLARAYRDAILAYARRHGAENIHCQEGEDVVEIEFNIQQ